MDCSQWCNPILTGQGNWEIILFRTPKRRFPLFIHFLCRMFLQTFYLICMLTMWFLCYHRETDRQTDISISDHLHAGNPAQPAKRLNIESCKTSKRAVVSKLLSSYWANVCCAIEIFGKSKRRHRHSESFVGRKEQPQRKR